VECWLCSGLIVKYMRCGGVDSVKDTDECDQGTSRHKKLGKQIYTIEAVRMLITYHTPTGVWLKHPTERSRVRGEGLVRGMTTP
jgi:hypothetical protein